MNEPKFLTEINDLNLSSDYDLLLKEGISLIQKFSGNKWTDFNYHDPGITLLEQICYALTDLGYRSSFNLEDILLINKDNFDLENENLLIPLNKILSSQPLTLIDYRKFILQRIDNVKNVWIEKIKDNSIGLDGLLSVSVQCNENLSENDIVLTKNRVYDLLMNARSISTDIEKINILNKEKIEISAIIILDPFALGESVLAEIYHKLDNLFNPEIILNDLEKMKKIGYDDNEIFSGPQSKFGYIDSNDLSHKTNSIYSVEIKELIESVKGVVNIKEIKIFKNGIHVFDDLITFNENSYPSLKKTILDYNDVDEKIVFLRNDSIYGIDSIILSQLYDTLILDSKLTYRKNINTPFLNDLFGRFNKDDISKYYSIQNEFPSIYGLKKDELPKNSNKKRVAQVNQLKAYLYFFEQIMSNFLSQLANTRNFFSLNSKKVFFNQIPKDIPDLNKIIIDDLNTFKNNLDKLLDQGKANFDKKNQILDHLLSRFNEQFDLTILSKLSQLYDEEIDQEKMLDAKIKYSNFIVELGKSINKGFNYNNEVFNTLNCSGLEKRLKLLLNFYDLNIKSLSSSILNKTIDSNKKNSWVETSIKLEDNLKLEIFSLPEKNYNSNEVFFYTTNNKDFKSLFIYGKKKKSYKIIKSQTNNNKYSVLYNSPVSEKPIRIFSNKDKSICSTLINNSIKKFDKLNINSEGFYIVEHILLRPSSIINYKNYIYNDTNDLILESLKNSDFEKQKDYRSDLYLILDSPKYYEVNQVKTSSKFFISVSNVLGKRILKSNKYFKTKDEANNHIKFLVNFFIQKKQNNIPVEEISQIKMDIDKSNEFPSNFKFSNKISFICPNWPARFQNTEFISLFKLYIKKYIPAHIDFNFFLLNLKEISVFEDIYFNWLKKKSKKSKDLDKYSIQLIQLINNYKI
tara:strand:- start:17439 stop:20180 length:2742 start_codon:yes stop_codon:yes gene_type:complete